MRSRSNSNPTVVGLKLSGRTAVGRLGAPLPRLASSNSQRGSSLFGGQTYFLTLSPKCICRKQHCVAPHLPHLGLLLVSSSVRSAPPTRFQEFPARDASSNSAETSPSRHAHVTAQRLLGLCDDGLSAAHFGSTLASRSAICLRFIGFTRFFGRKPAPKSHPLSRQADKEGPTEARSDASISCAPSACATDSPHNFRDKY